MIYLKIIPHKSLIFAIIICFIYICNYKYLPTVFTMINSEDFIKRLEILFEYYSLSASAFADKIGVQRSALSHLLSGRNKPSLDFVMRIIESYPDVDLYWLLNGIGSFPKNNTGDTNTEIPAPILSSKRYSEEASEKPDPLNHSLKIIGENEVCNTDIDSITIFYKDGTFKNYKGRK